MIRTVPECYILPEIYFYWHLNPLQAHFDHENFSVFNMIIYKQTLSKLQPFSLVFSALILIILSYLLLPIKPAIYPYLIFNLLVLVLGVESGLLKALSKPSVDSYINHPKNVAGSTKSSTHVNTSKALRQKPQSDHATVSVIAEMILGSEVKLMRDEVNSSPSIFFVGYDSEAEGESVDDVIAGRELLTRSEDFIQNFYKHLCDKNEAFCEKFHVPSAFFFKVLPIHFLWQKVGVMEQSLIDNEPLDDVVKDLTPINCYQQSAFSRSQNCPSWFMLILWPCMSILSQLKKPSVAVIPRTGHTWNGCCWSF